MKKLLLIVVALVVMVATVPLWGGCDLEYKLNNAWCSIRHLNSDTEELSCKARALATKVKCIADKGAGDLGVKM